MVYLNDDRFDVRTANRDGTPYVAVTMKDRTAPDVSYYTAGQADVVATFYDIRGAHALADAIRQAALEVEMDAAIRNVFR